MSAVAAATELRVKAEALGFQVYLGSESVGYLVRVVPKSYADSIKWKAVMRRVGERYSTSKVAYDLRSEAACLKWFRQQLAQQGEA